LRTTRKNTTPAITRLLAAAWLCGAALATHAETQAVSDSGFTVVHASTVNAEPEAVWKAFTQLPRWWNPRHSWSGQPDRMSLDLQAGGCWCERWGDGASAQHGRVLMVLPGNALRLEAKLGPLQERAVNAVLTLGTARRDGQTRLRMSYVVAGAPGPAGAGLDTLAPAVDGVMAEQFARLLRFIETGRPE
jgi:uncharacterized protein YndB with AHSA1/START domain